MSAPRTKRQFAGAAADPAQRQITTYFASAGGPPPPATAQGARSPQLQPHLPASVQSSLLSVGMRVRKSVPEGYKTGSSFGAFKLWEEAAAGTTTGSGAAVRRAARTSARADALQRELMPFCGIHRVGGLAVQPGAHGGYDDEDEEEADCLGMPGLTSTQETLGSADDDWEAEAANTRKRVYEEDDGEVGPAIWADGEEPWSGAGPRPAQGGNARVFAVPKKASGRRGAPGPALAGLGQENTVLDDFEDAEFLDAGVFSGDADMSGV